MAARIHGNKSNRASATKATPNEKKVVFKSVLDSPYEITWPSVRPNVVNSLVARVVDLFDGVAEFTTSRDRSYRKRKRTSDASIHVESEAKRPRLPDSSDPHSSHTDPQPSEPALLPRAWSHLLVGINEVTKRLEWQASTAPKSVTINSSEPASSVHPSNRPVSVIFACIHDVKNPLLLAHLPRLVASCNSRYTALDDGRPTIRLVPCPKGTETILAGALGFRRASVVALEIDTPDLDRLDKMLALIPILTAPWLTSGAFAVTSDTEHVYEPTHVKQLRTTAPKDIKAVKEQRAQGKAAAKLRREVKGIISKKSRNRSRFQLGT